MSGRLNIGRSWGCWLRAWCRLWLKVLWRGNEQGYFLLYLCPIAAVVASRILDNMGSIISLSRRELKGFSGEGGGLLSPDNHVDDEVAIMHL